MIPVAALIELGIKLLLVGWTAWENRETTVSEDKLLALRASLTVEQTQWAALFPDLFPPSPAPLASPTPPEAPPTPVG